MGMDIPAIIAISFVAFALIQIFYLLWFFVRLCFYKQKSILTATDLVPVSIIICAKNEERNLQERLQRWVDQKYFKPDGSANFEVLIVDDNSEDGSAFFYNTVREQYPSYVRVLQLRQEAKGIKGKKFPLSMGIKEAKYETLLLTDADCTPASDLWLHHMVSEYSNSATEIVLGYSNYEKESTFLNRWIRWETVHTAIQYLSYSLAGKTYMGVGRNLSYLKPVFLANKGFSSHSQLISGDDDLFINQVAKPHNTRICIHKESFTTSTPKASFDSWWFQKSRHVSTARLYKKEHRFLLGMYSVSHTMFWLTLLPAVFCVAMLPIVAAAFGGRFLLHWIIFGINAVKLDERDLVARVPLFDLLTLYYNLRLFPQLFRSSDIWK
jgi:glycosyltransferase involved in cell wall biosynthesis